MNRNTYYKKILNLTCNEKDVLCIFEDCFYDKDEPFKKYYNKEIFFKAIDKFITNQWDQEQLTNWCYSYISIIEGGHLSNSKEKFNFIEEFVQIQIIMILYSLSGYEKEEFDDYDSEFEWLKDLKYILNTLDFVYKTSANWHGLISQIGNICKEEGDSYVLLINDISKQYLITYSYYKKENQSDIIQFTTEENFISKLNDIKSQGYSLISFEEEDFYNDIKN